MRAAPMIVLLGLLLAPAAAGGEETLVPDWRGLSRPPWPAFEHPGAANPVLTVWDIDDASVYFVADPFLYRDAGNGEPWWLFFEAACFENGNIAVATSTDGLAWDYAGMVLDEPWHLSYPLVFRWGDSYYMVPESAEAEGVGLYRAESGQFPFEWTFVAWLARGRPFADPTLFRHQGRWWLFVGSGDSATCWLYTSPVLDDPEAWREHPCSPIVVDSRSRARPAGRAFIYDGGRLVRLAQKSDVFYGEMVRAFEVTELSLEAYAETELPESPILAPVGGDAWNSEAMHHFDPWWTGDGWLCAVDGHDPFWWTIGIYCCRASLTAAPASAPAACELRPGRPNPFRDRARLRYRLARETSLRLTVHDARGRRLAVLDEGVRAAGAHELSWDGRDARGRLQPAGVYLLRLETPGGTAARKLLRLP